MSPLKGAEPVGAGLQGKVDKVYTVGCFDLLHQGHLNLFERMRQLGKEVSVVYSLGVCSVCVCVKICVCSVCQNVCVCVCSVCEHVCVVCV